ncbi:MAG: PDZ domain-containing protein [Bacilli bacterium]
MFNKVYVKIKNYLKQNIKFIIILLFIFFVMTFELPYYINTPGGLIDVSKRISIEDSYQVEGSFNLAYVSEFKATLPTLFWAYIDKDWDILKKEEVLNNETLKEIDFRNHLMLTEANQNAVYVGFNKALEYTKITNQKVFVVYIDNQAKTDLKIGDEILKINNEKITSKQDVYKILKKYKKDDVVNLTVLRDNKEVSTTGTLFEYYDNLIIGLVLCETKDIDTNKDVNFSFKASESGPSGGFMMALSIYNYLTPNDITNGKKIVGTGTIDEFGNVGSIGGIEYKIKAAAHKKADVFFAPAGANYETALKEVQENKLDIELIAVNHIDDAIAYLNKK